MRTEDLVLTGHVVEERSFHKGRVLMGFVRGVAQGAGPVPATQDGVALCVERSEPGLEGG
jgi:hypothetical protein